MVGDEGVGQRTALLQTHVCVYAECLCAHLVAWVCIQNVCVCGYPECVFVCVYRMCLCMQNVCRISVNAQCLSVCVCVCVCLCACPLPSSLPLVSSIAGEDFMEERVCKQQNARQI
ncbi:unnamed protein product [Boreogadus saida]